MSNLITPQTQQAKTGATVASSGILQRKCASCGTHTIAGDQCADCRNKQDIGQRKSSTAVEHSEVPPIVHEVLRASGQPLDQAARSFFEPRFERNFVRVPIGLSAAPVSGLTVGRASDKAEAEADDAAERALNSPPIGNAPKSDFSRVRIHTGNQAAQAARAVDARAFTVGNHIVFGEGEYKTNVSDGKRLIAHELAHVLQQSGDLTQAATLRRRPKSKSPSAPTAAAAWFSVVVSRPMNSTELLAEVVGQYCDAANSAAQARSVCRQRLWNWAGEAEVATEEDAKKGYKLIKVRDNSLTAQDDQSRQENRKDFQSLGADEKTKIHAEADRRFWEKSQYKKGIKLGESADDKKMAEYWMAVRDELLRQRKQINSLPPELQKFFFDENALTAVEPKDYETFLRIVSKVAALSPAELEEYKSRVTATTTDWSIYESSVDRFLAERKERAATAEEKRTMDTRLFGLDALYDRYRLYLSMLKTNTSLAGMGRVNPGALGTALGTQSTLNKMRSELEADLIVANFPGGIAEFEQFIDSYEKNFERETLAVAKVMLEQYEHQLYSEEQQYQNSGKAAALAQSLAAAGAKADYEEAEKIRDEHAQTPMTPDEIAEQSYWIGRRNEALARGESKVMSAAGSANPLVGNVDFDREKLARAPQDKVQGVMLDYIAARRRDINETQQNIKDKPAMIYGLKLLLEASFRLQNIQSGSIQDKIIRNHIKDVNWSEAIPHIILGVVAVAAGLLSGGSGAVAVLAAGTALGIGSYQAYEEFRRYETKMSAYGAKMISEEPSMVWVIVAVVGAGIDAAVLVSALSKVPQLRLAIEAFNSGPEADDVVKLTEKLDKLTEVEEAVRTNIIRAAQAEVDARQAWKGITRTQGVMAIPSITVLVGMYIGKLAYAVYHSARRGIREFSVFVKTNEAIELIGDIAKLTPTELAQFKTGYLEAVKQMETVAAHGKSLGMAENEIRSFMNLRGNTPGMTVEQLTTEMNAWKAAKSSGVPFGFENAGRFEEFQKTASAELSKLLKTTDRNAEAFLQGSAVSGVSYKRHVPFDLASDFDVAVSSRYLFAQAKKAGYEVKLSPNRIGPLDADQIAELGLRKFAARLGSVADEAKAAMAAEKVKAAEDALAKAKTSAVADDIKAAQTALTEAKAAETASAASSRRINIMLFDNAEAVRKPIGAASAETERAAVSLKTK